MLTVLRVKRFAIIDEVEVELGPGLNVVTGETGAGKSILIDALQLVLGARANADAVRTGAETAEVEALFSPGHDIASGRLDRLGLPADDEILVRRSVQSQGRSRAYVNGRLATASQLAALSHGLVDICSQHEHHTLVDHSTHIDHLDTFAGLGAERAQVAAAWAVAQDALQQRDGARDALDARGEREELLRFQLNEIDRIGPQPGEDEELRAEAERLGHAVRLAEAAGNAEQLLYSADDAIIPALDRVGEDLRDAGRHDEALAQLAERVESARTELEEAARDLSGYLDGIQADPERQQEIEARLHALRRLTRRFGGSLDAVLEHAATAREELAGLEDGEGRLAKAEARLAAALAEARRVASLLSAARKEHAAALGEAISGHLAGLGMGDARVLVEVAPVGEARDGEVQVDGARLTERGIDRAEFLIAPNPGEQPKPLRKVASGGELSRALLALKCVLGSVDPGGLYVFDEVDSGVGGAVAEVIGQKLRAISRDHQVLCITHLPQIAAYADRHFRVEKQVRDGRTHSRIVRLDDDQRTEELARMLGGIEVTDASRQAAVALRQAAG